MKISNDCNLEEDRLTFEVDGQCVDVVDLLTSCDNSYIITLLNKMIQTQKECCEPTIIRVPREVVKYIEIRTTVYEYRPRHTTLPKPKVITLTARDNPPSKGWTSLYKPQNWWYKDSPVGRFFAHNPNSTWFWGKVKNVISEETMKEKYPYYEITKPYSPPKKDRQEIKPMSPKQWEAYYKSQRR